MQNLLPHVMGAKVVGTKVEKNSPMHLGGAIFFLFFSKTLTSIPVPEYVGKFSSIPVPVVPFRGPHWMYLYPTCTCCTSVPVAPVSLKKYLFQALVPGCVPWAGGGLSGA